MAGIMGTIAKDNITLKLLRVIVFPKHDMHSSFRLYNFKTKCIVCIIEIAETEFEILLLINRLLKPFRRALFRRAF